MDFGLLYELQATKPWKENRDHEVYWNSIEQVKAAERAGFTHVWGVEHHFVPEWSHLSSPEIWLAALAQHTSTIRLGFGVAQLLPKYNHPVRVAERAAALDILSNGRVDLGTGRVVNLTELEGWGITGDTKEMWRESLQLIAEVFLANGGPVDFTGKYSEVHAEAVLPLAIQKPHPPLWLAATSPPTYALAGECGLGVLAFGMAIDAPAMGRRIDEYHAAMAKGTPVGAVNDNVALFQMAFCAETDAAAAQKAQRSVNYYMDGAMRHFLQWGRGGVLPPGYEWYVELSKHADEQSAKGKYEYLDENALIMCGSPETICERIELYRKVGVTQVLMAVQYGDLAHEDVMESIELIGDQVIPNFR
jgi:alkanesulfonate monooxygenase SsuD/methylene tetrahydromethanopterin reductase-like flavin-dependent oxidoreductase (luciferase family)